jgi:hypothetical protein
MRSQLVERQKRLAITRLCRIEKSTAIFALEKAALSF